MTTIKEQILDCLQTNKKEMTNKEITEWIVDVYGRDNLTSNKVSGHTIKFSNPDDPKAFLYVNRDVKPKQYGLLIWQEEEEEEEETVEEIIEDNFKYTVYLRKMTATNKIYVGITKDTPEIRAGETGEKYKNNKEFNHDIRMYGWANVVTEILYEGLTREEALEKEHMLISMLDARNPEKGYNIKK